MFQEEQVQRLAERMQEQGSVVWRTLDMVAARLPLSTYVRHVMQLLGAWTSSLLRKMHKALHAAAENALVILVGLLIGINMAIISVVTEWASDLRRGYCSSAWWLNQKFCCWAQLDPAGPGGSQVPKHVAAAAQAASGGAMHTVVDLASRMLIREANATTAAAPEVSCTEWVVWSHWSLLYWAVYVSSAGLFVGVSAYFVKHYASYAAGSGISEIKCVLSGFNIRGFLSLGTLVIKSLGLPLVIASGLSVGKEGPAVHMACCIGNVVATLLHRLVPSESKTRELLTAASAAGVAVAFGSPIGGVLFALEEMTSHFPASTMWRSFLCALASTVALSFMNPYRTGKLVLFQVEYNHEWHYFELVFHVVIGIAGGLYGEYVVRYYLQVQRFRRKRLSEFVVIEAVVLATLTALVSYWNRFLFLDMSESLAILFQQCEGASETDVLCQKKHEWPMAFSLLVATLVRFVFVALSYGCKVPAGIFVPSMAIGATFGRMVGILVKALQTAHPTWNIFSACPAEGACITPGTYAMLGAAAAMAGVTRITVAVVVIMFELTGALTYVLPTMLVVGTAKLVADLHGHGGVSDRSIKFNGYPYLEKDEQVFGIDVGAIMTRKPAMLYANGMNLDALYARLAHGSYKGFPVVRSAEDPTLVGYASRRDVRYTLQNLRHTQAMQHSTQCLFTPHGAEAFALNSAVIQDDAVRTSAAPYDVWNRFWQQQQQQPTEEEFEMPPAMTDTVRTVDLGVCVDPTPLIVQAELDLEVVADMFKSMGPRVILVVERGGLRGMVTIKDLLRHVASKEHAELRARDLALPTQGSDDEGVASVDFGIGTGNVEVALDCAWVWLLRQCSALQLPAWLHRNTARQPDHAPLEPIYEAEEFHGPDTP